MVKKPDAEKSGICESYVVLDTHINFFHALDNEILKYYSEYKDLRGWSTVHFAVVRSFWI